MGWRRRKEGVRVTGPDVSLFDIVVALVRARLHAPIATAADINSAASVAIFSYTKDFDELWRLSGAAGISKWLDVEGGTTRTVIIVWDGEPDANVGAVPASKYLTPFDWIVTITLNLGRGSTYPPLRVIVIDLRSEVFDSAYGPLMFRILAARLSWVRVYGPTGTSGLEEFVDDLCANGPQPFERMPTLAGSDFQQDTANAIRQM